SDKTGTLTMNRMRVEDSWLAPGVEAESLWRAAALNNDSVLDASGAWLGDPTEVAQLEAAQRAGPERAVLSEAMPRLAELPFDADRKRMSTVHRLAAGGDFAATDAGGRIAYMKGAPEMVLPRCAQLAPQAQTEAQRMAEVGLRLIAFAERQLPDGVDVHDEHALERDMRLLGIVGLTDPPRDEARPAVDECSAAGIVPVLITGAHPSTAAAVARALGILDAAEAGDGRVLTGAELARLDDDALADRVQAVRVYARVDPEQKIRIVGALQARGQYVAMTGDGVNDAPALRRADIGVAMGRGGTDVAREAASLVLLEDNFATIVRAVREGRRIYDNIRKFIRYTMSSNAGEIWALVLAPMFGLPVPLAPIQILWINLVTDGLPGLALASEPAEPGTMRRPPRPPAESFFAQGLWQHVIWVGLLMGVLCTFVFWLAQDGDPRRASTMVFVTLTLCQVYGAFCNRSERQSLLRIGWLGNRPLLLALAITVALQLLVVYVPALNPIFKTVALDARDLVLCFALSVLVLVAIEIEKLLARRNLIYREPAT
ncbi:MAG: cation-transporting P-type ATPase, partial [Burkholderiales bacterium]